MRALEPWILPAIGLTVLNYGACEALRPITGLRGHIDLISTVASIGVFLEVGFIFLFAFVIRLALQGVEHPIARLRVCLTPMRIVSFVTLAVVANLNLSVLGEVKSQLNQLVGFSADASLANIDRAIFLGTDPWRALVWLDHPYLAEAYHFGWIIWVTAALIYVGVQAPNRRKDVLLTAYFTLWTLGPLIHFLSPAAGPLFFDQLGLGARFTAIPEPPHTQFIENYLWHGYQTRTINYAGGISAMPSLHIATMVWAAIVFYRTRAFPLAIGLALYIFAASIVTGWHYASDGIAGAVLALATYQVCRRVFFASWSVRLSTNRERNSVR